MRFVLVATEDSGDILGASIIETLKKAYPHARFDGIGGQRMQAQGFHSLFPMERLSVMGFIEPLKRLPEILNIRSQLIKHVLQVRPAAFIGIDGPDFNLALEKKFKRAGIKTVHAVSPTIWAWRKGRLKTIKKAVDLMLALFPFEIPLYRKNAIKVSLIGHPMADKIPLESDKIAKRAALGLPKTQKIVALLPGSRAQELRYLLPPFLETATWLLQKDENMLFVSACANPTREKQFKAILAESPNAPPIQLLASAIDAMTVADVVLVASGTASLESMLVKRPTVVAYKTSSFNFQLATFLIHAPFIALPNLLARKKVMPEYIQHQVTPEILGGAIYDYFAYPEIFKPSLVEFTKIHNMLRKNTGESAANAIIDLIKETS